jgi:hypothetical protein
VRRVLAVVSALAAALIVIVGFGAAPAAAEIKGPCHAEVNSINVDPLPVDDPSQAIKVNKDDTLTYFVASSIDVRSRDLVLSFAGVDVTVDHGSSGSSSSSSDRRSGSVKVGDYAWMGAGLYQVAGVAHLANGQTCSGAVLIDVQGSPLGTVAGITGLILTMLGGAGIIVGAIRRGGGKQVQDIIDFIALSTGEGGPGGNDPSVLVTAAGLGGPAAGVAATDPADTGAPPADAGSQPPEGDKPPRRRRGAPPVVDPVAAGGSGAAPGSGNGAAAPPVAAGVGGASPVAAHTPAAPPAAEPPAADPPAPTDPKPPPITGMTTVTAIGATGKALTEATNQLEGHIDSLPISDDQKDKIKSTLGTDKIKDTLDTVTSTVETVEHFEGQATDTIDKMNKWGINANGTNGLVWLQTMAGASGRLGQKFTDGLVKPVIEPIAKAAESAGIKVDADEVAHTLLPVQEAGDGLAQAMFNGAKNALGGSNRLDQISESKETEDEWRNIRTFN